MTYNTGEWTFSLRRSNKIRRQMLERRGKCYRIFRTCALEKKSPVDFLIILQRASVTLFAEEVLKKQFFSKVEKIVRSDHRMAEAHRGSGEFDRYGERVPLDLSFSFDENLFVHFGV